MRFQRHIKLAYSLQQTNIVPLLNVIFLLLISFLLLTLFNLQTGIDVHLLKALTSDVIKEDNFVVAVSSENLIYVNGKITTLKELNALLADLTHTNRPILIKADRRASIGRIVDVWDLCRRLGIERINIATNQEL